MFGKSYYYLLYTDYTIKKCFLVPLSFSLNHIKPVYSRSEHWSGLIWWDLQVWMWWSCQIQWDLQVWTWCFGMIQWNLLFWTSLIYWDLCWIPASYTGELKCENLSRMKGGIYSSKPCTAFRTSVLITFSQFYHWALDAELNTECVNISLLLFRGSLVVTLWNASWNLIGWWWPWF